MNNLLYILWSGIMDNPVLFKGMCLLVLCAVLGWLAYMAFQKMERSSKGVYPVALFVLGIGALICFLYSVYTLSPLLPNEKNEPVIEKTEYEKHEYLVFKHSKFSSTVIHNPDCPCRKRIWNK